MKLDTTLGLGGIVLAGIALSFASGWLQAAMLALACACFVLGKWLEYKRDCKSDA